MKKIGLFFLCCVILALVVLFVEKKVISNDRTTNLVTDTDSDKAKSDTKKEDVFENKVQAQMVTDETGKKRELKMSDVNIKDVGVYFSKTDWITNYSQVLDGHYYYLRSDSDGNGYTIYRDQGEKVDYFVMPWNEGYDNETYSLEGFVKYGEKFYMLMSHFNSEAEDYSDYGERSLDELAYIDMKKMEPVVIADVTEDHMMDDENILFCNIYKNSFYYDRRSKWQKWEQRAGTSMRFNFKGKHSVEKISVPINLIKAKPYLTYIDGRIYYGISSDKEVTLYSYDMVTKKEERIFNYERKEKYNSENIYLSIDEDYIYCQDYIIPRNGGKMRPVFRNAKKIKNGMIKYTVNEKYIFYIDKKDIIHRIDKKTKKDRVISKRKAEGIDCAGDWLYMRVRDKVWYSAVFQDEWSDETVSQDMYSDHLYCIDLDGENEKRIWKGGYREG